MGVTHRLRRRADRELNGHEALLVAPGYEDDPVLRGYLTEPTAARSPQAPVAATIVDFCTPVSAREVLIRASSD